MTTKTKYRVIQFGVGASGSEMVRIMSKKRSIEIVGALDIDPQKVGKDLFEVVGLDKRSDIIISDNRKEILTKTKADVVLHATAPEPTQIASEVSDCVKAGMHVVTISGIPYIWNLYPDVAQKIDSLAKRHKVTVLGTGLTPGFIPDALVVFFTGICADVKHIKVKRVNDMYTWGAFAVKAFGIGLTPSEFKRGVEQGALRLFDRLLQSHDMIADSLGWEIDERREIKDFIVASDSRETPHVRVNPGYVCGFKHIIYGCIDEEVKIAIEYIGMIRPDPVKDGIKEETEISIDGVPNVRVILEGDLIRAPKSTYISTAAQAVNAIPYVINAPPGLAKRQNLPLFTPLK
jgi:hypothetical protein